MYRVGLTGGIGSGKTTVSNLFKKLGVPIIDADEISRQLTEPGGSALALIIDNFGQNYVDIDGRLDRKKLRSLIFTEQQAKKKLESIIHPLVIDKIEDELSKLNESYCIIVIPLLFETGLTRLVDRILVIDCPEEIQISRVKKRDHSDEKTIRAIIDSQIKRELRCIQADDIIDNSESNSQLAEDVKKLHNLYLFESAR